jgi:hypothetical protein
VNEEIKDRVDGAIEKIMRDQWYGISPLSETGSRKCKAECMCYERLIYARNDGSYCSCKTGGNKSAMKYSP